MGGIATNDLLDPALTHIVVHAKIQGRYKQLINLTSK